MAKQLQTPSFKVKLSGKELTGEDAELVAEIIVADRVDTPSFFSVTIQDVERKLIDDKRFAEGTDVEIQLGFDDKTSKVLKGEVTGLVPRFNRKSGSFLEIRGSSLLHRLTRARKTRSFVNKGDADIIKDIASDSKLKATADRLGKPRPFTMQVDQTDYDYLMHLARIYNCRVWTEDKKLFFKSINVKARPAVTLAWERDGLLEFNPVLNTANLLTAVEVRGWDTQKSQAIVGTATTSKVKDKIGGRKLGADAVKAKFGEARMVYISDTIRDKKTAEDVALDVLTRNSMNYIVASGKCTGNNRILAGSIVKIDNVGKRFSGEYYVRSVRHEYRKASGYYTSFNLERNCT